MSRTSRADVFAQGALKKRLVTRAQAEECLAIAKQIQRRGKGLKIEDVFIRKGYLRPTEAASIARRLKKKDGPALDLVQEDRECPSCGRDPGGGDDCFRCGADLATGAPGPRATACGSCSQVVLRGTALCPKCARPVADVRRRTRSSGTGKVLVDRLIVLATLVGMGYFVHHHAIAVPTGDGGPVGEDVDVVAEGSVRTALANARGALEREGKSAAAAVLEGALAELGPQAGGRRTLLRALAEVAEPARAVEAAREALGAGDAADGALHRRLAELALRTGKGDAAATQLEAVAADSRDDAYWRLCVEVQRARGEAWLEPLLHLATPTQAEARAAALALLVRARGHQKNRRGTEALRDLRRARKLDPNLAEAHLALGLHLLEAGLHEDALTALRQAARLDTSTAETYLALGLALEAQGNVQAAVASYGEFLRQAEQAGADAARVARAKARLAALQK